MLIVSHPANQLGNTLRSVVSTKILGTYSSTSGYEDNLLDPKGGPQYVRRCHFTQPYMKPSDNFHQPPLRRG